MRNLLVILLCCSFALGSRTSAQKTDALLVFTKTVTFRHDSIPAGVAMLEQLAEQHGYVVDHTEDAGLFTDEALARYGAVIFLSTTGDVLDEAQQAAFVRYIRSGGAYVGIHAAADTEHDWPWYGELVGARFHNHPEIQTAIIEVADREHPSSRTLPTRWERTDEWYNYQTNPRREVHVLLTLDERSYEGGAHGDDHPIAWCREHDGGRSWYTGLGHTAASFGEPLFREHVLGGLLWALGTEAATCRP